MTRRSYRLKDPQKEATDWLRSAEDMAAHPDEEEMAGPFMPLMALAHTGLRVAAALERIAAALEAKGPGDETAQR